LKWSSASVGGGESSAVKKQKEEEGWLEGHYHVKTDEGIGSEGSSVSDTSCTPHIPGLNWKLHVLSGVFVNSEVEEVEKAAETADE